VTAAVITSRRVSAGIRPEPGATSALPAWWGAEDWTDDVAHAVTEHRDVCRSHHVEPDTVVAVARGMASFADHRTGRSCRPTNAKLVELLQVSLSTVQRARRVLKDLKLVVELVGGRSIMTRAERLAAWRRGSSHRNIAAEFALTARRAGGRAKRGLRDLREGLTVVVAGGEAPSTCGQNRRPRRQVVDGDTPPGSTKVSTSLKSRSSLFARQTEKNEEGGAPRHSPTKGVGRRAGVDPAARRLAEAVRGRTSWLRAVSAARMTPTLSRFARDGWTPRDVELGVRDAMAARGWKVVPRDLKQPAAYLATLLRELDPADRPTAAEAHMVEVERREDAHRLQLAIGAPCRHGRPAGDVPSPLRGHIACLDCRREIAG